MEIEGQNPELGLNQVRADAIALPAPIVHKGARVITTELLAKCYGCDAAHIQDNYRKNLDRFESGRHFVRIEGGELKGFKNRPENIRLVDKRASALILWTARGAARHAKMLGTDAAWLMFERMEDAYFADHAPSADPMAMLNDPAALRQALLTYSEKVITLQAKVAADAPSVAAFDRISRADGSFNGTEAAKALQVRPKDLFGWLRANSWIYKRPGGKYWLGYSDKVASGMLEHKVVEITLGDGTSKVTEHVRITAKGLAKLAVLFGVTKQ